MGPICIEILPYPLLIKPFLAPHLTLKTLTAFRLYISTFPIVIPLLFYSRAKCIDMPYASKRVGRFRMEAIGLKNAIMLSVYEEPKLGSLLVSTPVRGRAEVDAVIPPKKGMDVASLLSESLSVKSGKIGVLAFSCESPPSGEEARGLLEGIKLLVEELGPS